MSSFSELMSRATAEERLRRADELRAGRPGRRVTGGRPSMRHVRRAAIRMVLMRRSRRGDHLVVRPGGGGTLGNQRDQRVPRADSEIEFSGGHAAVNGVANADHLLGASQ